MISVIVPCYNEKEVLPLLHERLTAAAAKWSEKYEVILVDDGSNVETWEELKRIKAIDNRWKIIRFSRNFGHQAAVSAGLYHSTGDCVVIIDADLQDPPEEIHRFIEKWKAGYDIVYGIRQQRKENIFKRIAYKAFYRILGRLANIDIPLDSGDFCLMDRIVVDQLNQLPEHNRFIRGLRAWLGFRHTGVAYERAARAKGEPQYTLKKLIQLSIDGVFSFSIVPLRMVTMFGLFVSVIAMLGAIYTLLHRLFEDMLLEYGFSNIPQGFTTLAIAILFLGGVQLISLGVLGEYVGRIYDEVKRRPSWIIQEILN